MRGASVGSELSLPCSVQCTGVGRNVSQRDVSVFLSVLIVLILLIVTGFSSNIDWP